MHWHKVVSLSFLFFSVFNSINSLAYEYDAPKAAVAPVIDGNGSDACWTSAYWYNMNQTWIGSAPTPADFSGRFKVSWDKNKIYLLAEITDDVLNDSHTDPLDRYYDDDALEILLDENKSLGGHEKSYNAFAYHVSSLLDVVDVDVSGNAKLFNDHMEVKYFKSGNVYIWECAINIYTDQFKYGALANPVVELVAGKKLGFSLAYCDNDGGP